MNDLAKYINNISIPILFADGTSILFTHSNIAEFNVNIHTVLDIIHTWFKEILSHKKKNHTHTTQQLIIFAFRHGIAHLLTWRLAAIII
jgi:hypothetical protein